jgi:serine/threonine protein kinase
VRYQPGDRIGKYVIEEFVAHGVSGDVYRATKEPLDRDFALKVLHPELIHDSEARDRLRREARALCMLRHPNVVGFYGFEEEDGLAYIVMDFVRGETLEQRIARGPLPEKKLIEFGLQLASALAEAHRKEILHRDLKPSNVMLSDSGEVVLIDFGLAKTNLPRTSRSRTSSTSPARWPISHPRSSLEASTTRAPISTPWGWSCARRRPGTCFSATRAVTRSQPRFRSCRLASTPSSEAASQRTRERGSDRRRRSFRGCARWLWDRIA